MLVLDANILIRAVPGSRVPGLLRKYVGQVEFMVPDVAFQEAREHLPAILKARRIPVAPAMAALDLLARLVQTVCRCPCARLPDLDRRHRRLDAISCA